MPLFAGMFMFTACDGTDFQVEDQIPDRFHKILYLQEYGKVNISLFDLPEDYTYPMTLVKGGSSINESASVKLIVSSQEEVTEKYSNIESVDYRVLPSECYTLSATDINFSESDVSKDFSVIIHPQVVKGCIESGNADSQWVLPLVVTSESDSINASRNELFLMIDDVITPSVGFVSTSSDKGEFQYGLSASISEMVQFRLDFDNQWDINCKFIVDNDYIGSYNAANGTNYKQVPENLVSLASSMELPKGTSAQLLPVQISELSSLPVGDYMLPVRISEVEPFEVSSSNGLYVLTFSVAFKTEKVDRINWTITANTEELTGENNGNNGHAEHAIDGDVTTYWHSQWLGSNAEPPYEIVIDMHATNVISSIGLMRRSTYLNVFSGKFLTATETEPNTWVEAGSFRFSWVNENGTTVEGANGTQYDPEEVFPLNSLVACRYIKILLEYNDINHTYSSAGHMAEIYAYKLSED